MWFSCLAASAFLNICDLINSKMAQLWQLIYSADDLNFRIQSFSKESKIKGLLRIALFLANANNALFIVMLYDVHRLVKYFTNITLLATIVFFTVACRVTQNSSMNQKACHHVLFEITMLMNLVVVIVYWPLLHEDSLEEAGDNLGKIINCYVAHIVPCASVMLNFQISDVVFKRSHIVAVPVIAVCYGVQNYYETQKNGSPLYWFLTWEDKESVFIYGGLVSFAMLLFMACTAITEGIKRSNTASCD